MFCSCHPDPVSEEEQLDRFPRSSANGLAERGSPCPRWYPCRISCKPSQGPPMRGTCPPKRPIERLVQSYAENYSAISWKYSGKYPCLPGKAVPNREPTSVGAGHKNRSFSKTPQTAFPCLFHCDITHYHLFCQNAAKSPLWTFRGLSMLILPPHSGLFGLFTGCGGVPPACFRRFKRHSDPSLCPRSALPYLDLASVSVAMGGEKVGSQSNRPFRDQRQWCTFMY